mgnify:CR=1 FL=1
MKEQFLSVIYCTHNEEYSRQNYPERDDISSSSIVFSNTPIYARMLMMYYVEQMNKNIFLHSSVSTILNLCDRSLMIDRAQAEYFNVEYPVQGIFKSNTMPRRKTRDIKFLWHGSGKECYGYLLLYVTF